MILGIKVNNFLVFGGQAQMSLVADMRIKKFYSNVHSEGGFNILKSACIYGGNNVGKTCMLKALAAIKAVLSDSDCDIPANIFSSNAVCTLGVSFTDGEGAYSYEFSFDNTPDGGQPRGFVSERFASLSADKYGNVSERDIFVRDIEKDSFFFEGDKELSSLLGLLSSSNILIYAVNDKKYPAVARCKAILTSFARSVEVVDMNNIPIDKTVSVLKNDLAIRERTVELIKLADLDIDDYVYSEADVRPAVFRPQENVLSIPDCPEDMYRLTSIHRGKPVRSLTFDSTGTKKMVAIASYIIEALTEGKILVVDEIDSSLHFKLTRAIVSLFNNELNSCAQLIFTVHDVTLLDCRKLFRKDQIWFASKEDGNVKLYSLASFTAGRDNVRSDTDILEKYKSGALGALPEPDLIAVLLGRGDDEEQA